MVLFLLGTGCYALTTLAGCYNTKESCTSWLNLLIIILVGIIIAVVAYFLYKEYKPSRQCNLDSDCNDNYTCSNGTCTATELPRSLVFKDDNNRKDTCIDIKPEMSGKSRSNIWTTTKSVAITSPIKIKELNFLSEMFDVKPLNLTIHYSDPNKEYESLRVHLIKQEGGCNRIVKSLYYEGLEGEEYCNSFTVTPGTWYVMVSISGGDKSKAKLSVNLQTGDRSFQCKGIYG